MVEVRKLEVEICVYKTCFQNNKNITLYTVFIN